MTNCVNCGAILHGDKCEYCGTEYNDLKKECDKQNDVCIELQNGVCIEFYRDAEGILHRKCMK